MPPISLLIPSSPSSTHVTCPPSSPSSANLHTGINYHFAKQLLERNCSVLIADLALRPEAEELVKQYSTGTPLCVFEKTDVTDWKQLHSSISVTISKLGGLDIVGPGAGVFEEPWSNFWIPPGESPSRDAVDGGSYKTLDINITHPVRASQLAISEFLNPKDARDKASPANPKRIILTSSIAGQGFGVPFPLYFTSKHAISAFARSLGGLEAPLGIRVNCVAPGVVKTPLWTEHPEKLKIFNEEADTWVTPEEVAREMIRLLEDPELEGGTILEVISGSSRVVPAFMNPGPTGTGTNTSHGERAGVEAFERMTRKGWGKL
jgi:NAD(P)-dependent dehydrogenase (short-subunit alcohol dehydrogenase family)